jgi:hypothetical protein
MVFARTPTGVRRISDVATRFSQGYVVRSMAVDAARSRLLLVGEPSGGRDADVVGVGTYGVQVDSLRLDDLARGAVHSELAKPAPLGAVCGQLIRARFAPGLTTSTDGSRMFLGCLSNRGVVTLVGPNQGDVAGVVEVDLAAAARGDNSIAEIRPVAGDFANGDTMAWPGIPRIILIANGTSSTYKVFDTTHLRYVGNIGIDGIGTAAFGLDARTGRGYYLVDKGLGVFDPLATPVSQGTVHDELAPLLGPFQRPFEVDSLSGRVLAITSILADGSQPYVALLRGAPPAGESAAVGVASGGLDVAEVPGKTESSRAADAGAIGADFRMVGGPSSLLLNTTHFDSRGLVAKAGTRVEQFGVIRGSRLANDEAAVEAITSRQDDATTGDLNNTKLAVPLTCVDFGGRPIHLTADSLEISCDLVKQRVFASSSASVPRMVISSPTLKYDGVPAAVQLRSASSSVTQSRGADGVSQTVADAAAQGIDILGVVQIGRVTAHATVTAHGRTGTAKVDYARSVSGVVVNGVTVCSAECPFAQVQSAVNQALAGRARIDFTPPAVTAAKSGQEADLVDDPYRHLERVLFDDVPDDVVVKPALEVTVYADETTPSRLIASFAAISGRQIYQIFSLDEDFPAGPPVTPPVALPPTIGGPGDDLVPAVRLTDTTSPRTPHAPSATGGLLGQVVNGLRFALRSWHDLLPVAAVWALLAIPVYLSARRRLLLSLPFLQTEETP